MPKKLFFFSFTLAIVACAFLISQTQASTTVGANISSAGTLSTATSTLTGNLTVQDSNSAVNLFVDNNNHRIGILNANPQYALDLSGNLNMNATSTLYQNGLPVLVASSTTYNTLVGTQAGKVITTGTSNSFFGYQAGYTNTTGGSGVLGFVWRRR